MAARLLLRLFLVGNSEFGYRIPYKTLRGLAGGLPNPGVDDLAPLLGCFAVSRA